MAAQHDTDTQMPAASEPPSGDAANDADLASAPTLRELELLRQLALKQQEINDLASTLTLLTQNPNARPPPLPLPPPSPSAAAAELLSAASTDELVIPRALLPVLAHLRERGLVLAAENRELRQLSALPTVVAQDGSAASDGSSKGAPAGGKARRVDLARVVDRLRALTEENRELGTVIDELGREVGEGRGLKAALDEAHKMIEALDSDLEGSFGQIEALRANLAAYRETYGDLPDAHRP